MLLMYSLERMDVLPASDFGVREVLSRAEITAGTAEAGGTACARASLGAAPDRGCLVSVVYTALARSGACLNHFWNSVRSRRI